jgi:hypothetical protein
MNIINKLGGPSQVARKLGVTRQAVSKWSTTGKIPEGSAYKMLHVYGSLVTKEELGLAEEDAKAYKERALKHCARRALSTMSFGGQWSNRSTLSHIGLSANV